MPGTCSPQRWRAAQDKGWGLVKEEKIYKIIVLLMKKLQFQTGTQERYFIIDDKNAEAYIHSANLKR